MFAHGQGSAVFVVNMVTRTYSLSLLARAAIIMLYSASQLAAFDIQVVHQGAAQLFLSAWTTPGLQRR
jgi:hypothetical protein